MASIDVPMSSNTATALELEAKLKSAIKAGDQHATRSILRDLPARGKRELVTYALQKSCKYAKPRIVDYILDAYSQSLLGRTGQAITDTSKRTLLMLTLLALGEPPADNRNEVESVVQSLARSSLLHITEVDENGKTALMYPQTLNTLKQIEQDQDASKGKTDIYNAKDGGGQSVLMWALRQNNSETCEVALHLIQRGAKKNDTDKEGRNVLSTAIWTNRVVALRELLKRDQDRDIISSLDNRERNALHHLAADKDRCRSSNPSLDCEILRILIDAGADINKRDWRGRTCVFDALSFGNDALADALLKEKTTDMTITSKAGWTLLHAACEGPTDNVEIVKLLVANHLGVNLKTLRGAKTPLHVAVQAGNVKIINYLLCETGADRSIRDTYGNTPLLCALEHDDSKRAEIGALFAPWGPSARNAFNGIDKAKLEAATNTWRATVLDFSRDKNEGMTDRRHSIYNVIYRENPSDHTKPHFTTIAAQDNPNKCLRWIHLPANNTTWCRDLIIKAFVERGSRNIRGFMDLENSLERQHRGQKGFHHSRFMTPTCQTIHRLPETPTSRRRIHRTQSSTVPFAGDDKAAWTSRVRNLSKSRPENPRNSRSHERVQHQGPNLTVRRPSSTADSSNSSEALLFDEHPVDHLFLFMPYLHFEKFADLEMAQLEMSRPRLDGNSSAFRQLFHAYLHCDLPSLHIRRTLDQFFYHNIVTWDRDRDQVIHRYQKRNFPDDTSNHRIIMVDQLWMWVIDKDLIITSFPQVWQGPESDPMDILENTKETLSSHGHITNAYELATIIVGRCAGAHDGHGYGGHDYKILDMFESAVGEAMDAEVRLFKTFQRHAGQSDDREDRKDEIQAGDNRDVVAQTHGREDDKQMAQNVFGQPRKSSMFSLQRILSGHSFSTLKFTQKRRKLLLDNKEDYEYTLFNIGRETKLLNEVKDIRDELGMLHNLFSVQKQVIPLFHKAVHKSLAAQSSSESSEGIIEEMNDEQIRMFEYPLRSVEIMDKQITTVYENIRDTLDLKQKHVNNIEARASRTQAVNTAQQGRTVLIFTIVTVVFLPLSFIASFFDLDIDQFPRDANMNLSLTWVLRWLFAVSVPIATLCVIAAFLVGPAWYQLRDLARHLLGHGAFAPPPDEYYPTLSRLVVTPHDLGVLSRRHTDLTFGPARIAAPAVSPPIQIRSSVRFKSLFRRGEPPTSKEFV